LNEISQAAALQEGFKATPSPHSASEMFQDITVLKALQVRHTLLQKSWVKQSSWVQWIYY